MTICRTSFILRHCLSSEGKTKVKVREILIRADRGHSGLRNSFKPFKRDQLVPVSPFLDEVNSGDLAPYICRGMIQDDHRRRPWNSATDSARTREYFPDCDNILIPFEPGVVAPLRLIPLVRSALGSRPDLAGRKRGSRNGAVLLAQKKLLEGE